MTIEKALRGSAVKKSNFFWQNFLQIDETTGHFISQSAHYHCDPVYILHNLLWEAFSLDSCPWEGIEPVLLQILQFMGSAVAHHFYSKMHKCCCLWQQALAHFAELFFLFLWGVHGGSIHVFNPKFLPQN